MPRIGSRVHVKPVIAQPDALLAVPGRKKKKKKKFQELPEGTLESAIPMTPGEEIMGRRGRAPRSRWDRTSDRGGFKVWR